MFETLRVITVFLTVVIGVINGQKDSSNENTLSSPNDSNDDNSILDNLLSEATTTEMITTEVPQSLSDLFKGGLLEGLLNALIASPLGIIFKPLSLILRPIFWIVDTILTPVWFIVGTILTPVSWILDGLLLPVHGLSDLGSFVADILEDLLSTFSSAGSLVISNLSGLSSVALGQLSGATAVQSRKRRAIMDSMGMAWTTLTYPFRLVYDIISTILSPFYYLYKTVMWPFHFIFGRNADISDGSSSTSIATLTSYLPFSDMISTLLLKLSDSSQDAIIDLLKFTWLRTKEYLLPEVDKLILWAQQSQYVPDDVKTGLKSLHTAYSVLHMFGVL